MIARSSVISISLYVSRMLIFFVVPIFLGCSEDDGVVIFFFGASPVAINFQILKSGCAKRPVVGATLTCCAAAVRISEPATEAEYSAKGCEDDDDADDAV